MTTYLMIGILRAIASSADVSQNIENIARDNALRQVQCSWFKQRAASIVSGDATGRDAPVRWRDTMMLLWSYPGVGSAEISCFKAFRDGRVGGVEGRRYLASLLGGSCATLNFSQAVKAAIKTTRDTAGQTGRRADLVEVVLDKAARNLLQPMHLAGIMKHVEALVDRSCAVHGRRN